MDKEKLSKEMSEALQHIYTCGAITKMSMIERLTPPKSLMKRILKEKKIKLPNSHIFKQVKNCMKKISEKDEKFYEKKLIKIVEKKLKSYKEKQKQLGSGISSVGFDSIPSSSVGINETIVPPSVK